MSMCACSVAQSCLALRDPMDCSPPGSSIHGISQAIILEWVAISFSRDLPDWGIEPAHSVSPALAGGFFTTESRGIPSYLSMYLCMAQWVNDLPASAGVTGGAGSIPESGRSHRWGNGNLLQYSCLKNPMDRGAWQAIVQRVAKSWTWLSN